MKTINVSSGNQQCVEKHSMPLGNRKGISRDLTISCVQDTAFLQDFRCGISRMDDFIQNGLRLSIESNFCRLYQVKSGEETVAFFSLSFDALFLDSDDKGDLQNQGSIQLDTNYEETFWSKRHYPALEISYLAVREDLRGAGIGAFLVEEIVELAGRQDLAGCQFVTVEALTCAESNDDYTAVGFYSKMGFVPCEYRNPNKDTLRMYRTLYLKTNN